VSAAGQYQLALLAEAQVVRRDPRICESSPELQTGLDRALSHGKSAAVGSARAEGASLRLSLTPPKGLDGAGAKPDGLPPAANTHQLFGLTLGETIH